MPILSQRLGVFSKSAHDAGILIGDVPGTGGIQPVALTVLVSNVDPLDVSSDDYIIQCFPGNKFDDETDSDGNISVISTWTALDGPMGTSWGLAGGGNFTFANGISGQLFRALLASMGATIPFEVAYLDITMSSGNPADPGDFPNPIPNEVTITGQEDEEWDEEEEEGSAQLTFTIDDEDVDGVFFEYSEDGITWFPDGYVEMVPGIKEYTYRTYFFEIPATYEMRARAYSFPDESGTPSTPFTLIIPGSLPSVNMTMDGGIDLGGAATISFGSDPSGLYSLIPNKRNDTLYDRTDPEEVTTIDVAIPRPYAKTGFVP